jgi:hypothetical protein
MPDFQGARVRVTFAGRVMTGRLFSNAAGDDLVSLLPLTLTFRDLNGVEKLARLPRKLSVEGMPEGDDPDIGDIAYWAPGGDLVFYYGDVGYWNGIMRIGHFVGSTDGIAQQVDDFTATVELDERPL